MPETRLESLEEGQIPQEQTLKKISCLFVFRRKRKERLENFHSGEGPDEMLFGLNHLDPQKFQVDFVEGDDKVWSWKHRLCYPIELFIARQLGLGFALHIAVDNLEKLQQADIIVSSVDGCGLPIGALKLFGWLDTPVIYISHGPFYLIERLSAKYLIRKFFQKFYGACLKAVERVLLLGEGMRTPMAEMFQMEPQSLVCNFFGIDTQFWFPKFGEGAENYILSIGSDPARDYETLMKAIGEEHLKIVTRLLEPTQKLARNIELASEFTDLELRQLYQQAKFVVIPLHPVYQPSGQSATLQAMACGKAVILSNTPGLWDTARMQHQQNCYLVEPGKVSELRQAIRYLSSQPSEVERIGRNARDTVERFYSSARFATELEAHIQEVLLNSY